MNKICNVIGCDNHEMEIRESGKHKNMKGTYGYCQIHNIEGLVEESSEEAKV